MLPHLPILFSALLQLLLSRLSQEEQSLREGREGKDEQASGKWIRYRKFSILPITSYSFAHDNSSILI